MYGKQGGQPAQPPGNEEKKSPGKKDVEEGEVVN